jgi:proteasome lid subunit RPN8/RPN11
MKRLIIKKKHIDELKRIAESALPLEACALLIGIVKDDIIVEDIRLLRNAANSDIMFHLDPDEFYNIYKKVRDDGKDVVCIFHSHPSKPKPSQTDLKYMMINQIPWLIMSNIDYRFDTYIYCNGLKKVMTVLDPS